MIRMVNKVKEQQKTMRVPMKERQRKKQQKRDAEKEKSGRYLTCKTYTQRSCD